MDNPLSQAANDGVVNKPPNKLEKPFLPCRALILRKFSRLEYEKMCHPDLDDTQLRLNLSQRGADLDSLKHYDRVQKTCLHHIESTLSKYQIEWQTVDRFGYTEDKINWADVIITSGGDGTFLMAASKINTRDKPVIGVNSDPTKSVGHLCLPSQYSNNFSKVLELLSQGKYQWQFRQRLRITLIGDAADEEPRELYDMRLDLRGVNQFHEHDDCSNKDRMSSSSPVRSRSPTISGNACVGQLNYNQHSLHYHHVYSVGSPEAPKSSTITRNASKNLSPIGQDIEMSRQKQNASAQQVVNSSTDVSNYQTEDGKVITKVRQLREKALNEVFVGETLSARVSYYELSVDNNRRLKMKSSGLTVCTGTGSTSWFYNINKVTRQCVQTLVSLINKQYHTSLPTDDVNFLRDITQQFNETLTFPPNKSIMAYSVRDPVDAASNPSHNHRGYAKRIEVKSRMQNACLVIDGCQFYPFDDGSYALMETFDEDALRTITL